VVFSEWALADPQAWAYLRPILAENSGWALFISTPRGRNHLASFYDAARNDPAWFAEKLRADQTGVFSAEQLAVERREYIREFGESDGESRYNQEYLCDFSAAIVGAYFGQEMRAAEAEGRIIELPRSARASVITAWDLGRSDSTAIWFAQWQGQRLHLIDYIENAGVAIEWYAAKLKERGWAYEIAYLPHDAESEHLVTEKSIEGTLRGFGLRTQIVPRQTLQQGINAARLLLPRCWFDRERCARGIEALRQYRREWSDERKAFNDRPLHDWSSHGADAFRYLALGLRPLRRPNERPLIPDTRYVA
jgi:hypothetical protein